jgi:hypothetical protein
MLGLAAERREAHVPRPTADVRIEIASLSGVAHLV